MGFYFYWILIKLGSMVSFGVWSENFENKFKFAIFLLWFDMRRYEILIMSMFDLKL